MKKRTLAMLLTAFMFVCLLSTAAFAADTPTVTATADMVYSGQTQKLVSADVPSGYTMYYVMKTEDKGPTSTKAAGWGTKVPEARDAGTYYVWYYAKGSNGNADTEINSLQVTISPKTLEVGEIKALVSNPPVYNGTEQKPSPSVSVSVTVNGKPKSLSISKTKDYTLAYANNVNAGENTASVTVEAKKGGNYVFEDVTAKFSITKATAKVSRNSIALTEASRVYDPDDGTAEVKIVTDEGFATAVGGGVKNGEKLIIKSVSGSVSDNSAGNQTVAIKAGEIEYAGGADPANYKEVLFEDRLTLTITKATLTPDDFDAPTARELVEDGTPQQLVEPGSTPDYAVMYYRLAGDETWSDSVNGITGTDAGTTYTVEYYIDGGTNYEDLGSTEDPYGSVEVTIAPSTTGSVISNGSIVIIVAIAVIAAGAVIAIAVSKKKRSAN